jgi:hypothetical protein
MIGARTPAVRDSEHPTLISPKVGSARKFNIPDALTEFIEGNLATIEEGLATERRRDATRTAVEKSYACGCFEIGDRLRDHRLRHAEMRGRLHHAGGLNDREQNVEIAQAEPAADRALPFDSLRHSLKPIAERKSRVFFEMRAPQWVGAGAGGRRASGHQSALTRG